MLSPRPPVTALAPTLCLGSPAEAGVHTVKADGTGDFDEFQAAIDAAVDGDVLLVTPGSYDSALFTPVLDGKSLSIVGDGGLAWSPKGLIVRNLAPTQQVLLRGLGLDSLRIQDCDGTVWVEDCLSAGLPTLSPTPQSRARVVGSQAAHFNRCTIRGAHGALFQNTAGNHALEVEDSRVHLHDSALEGGHADGFSTQPGGDALRVFGIQSFAMLSGTVLAGGTGTPDGAGLRADGEVWVLNSIVGNVVPGVGYTPVALGALSRKLEVASPVREGGSLAMKFQGEGFDYVLLLASLDAGHFQDLFLNGVYQLSPLAAPTIVPIGLLPANGKLETQGTLGDLPPGLEGVTLYLQALHQLTPTIGELGPGVEGVVLYLQALHFSAPADFTLGRGSALLLLDSAF